VTTPSTGGGRSAGRGNAPGARPAASTARTSSEPPVSGTADRKSAPSGADRTQPSTGPARFAGAYPSARTRRARLKVAHVDAWSVMKLSFLLSIALGIMMFIAVAVLWTILNTLGVFEAVGSTVSDVTGSADEAGFDVVGFFSLSRVLGFTTLVAIIDVVLITALATIGAWLYNLSADLVGGVEVTLAEEQ
jgi:hypothetical protein